ncbi:hypothetical protein C5O25_05225 [Paramuribaculum intestinale]|uniref:Uncharacterized protein n=1 Tax=Paramuribaculum intestinale TaxID=2094151 RepID=A0A2V1IYD3_9BACT|nr:hypothetical protein C5O25_05225 [Paramuribaculum intestinale]ROS92127.1 hypothetical protein EEL36_09340 [Muribaculaceae bacterium Isolate-043 (Harlan)]
MIFRGAIYLVNRGANSLSFSIRFRDKVYSGKILRHIPENYFTEIDIPSEAPEKCLATRKDSTLIIVWCNLFADDKKVCETVKTILTAEK